MIDLIILVLAAWRITSVINRETAGQPVRKLLGEKELVGIAVVPDTLLGELYNCFWCLSVWISGFCVVVYLIEPLFLYPFAISTVAILLEEKVVKNGTKQRNNSDTAGRDSEASTSKPLAL